MARATFRRFEPRTQLKAEDLNAALEATVKQATFAAVAPRGVGLFRPAYEQSDANVFTMDGDTLNVTMLGAVLPAGDVVVIESGQIENFKVNHEAFLDEQGRLISAPTSSVPGNAFRLVHRKAEDKIEVVARIAALDADTVLTALDQSSRTAAQRWQVALDKGGRDAAVADAADTAALDPNVERKHRIAVLRLFSRALERRMSPEARARWPGMSVALAEPTGDQWPDLKQWLELWVTLMSNDALITEFIDPKGWRKPDSVSSGRNVAGAGKVRFDLEDNTIKEVEILSPNGFANSRWRFGESGPEQPFSSAKSTPEGWLMRLKTSGSKLYVWTDLDRPESLLMRPIFHATGTEK